MRRFLVSGTIVVVAVALIALLAFGIDTQGENTSIDSQVAHGRYPVAPDSRVAMPLLGGGHASLASYRGKVVILNIFASWCDPCQAEAPTFAQEQHMIPAGKATILGMTYLDNADDARQFMRTYHLSYPVVQDVNGNVVRSFGTDAVPETFVLDTTGHVVAVMRTSVGSAWLAHSLAKALQVSAA